VGFDPCGMTMDFLRSAYVTGARFFHASTAVAPIRWYRALDTSADFPDFHHFGSTIWLPAKGFTNPSVGEQLPATRSWRNGANAGAPPGTGFYGALADFQFGGAPLSSDRLNNPFGTPAACSGGVSVALETDVEFSFPIVVTVS
jgi:hypothetical protein